MFANSISNSSDGLCVSTGTARPAEITAAITQEGEEAQSREEKAEEPTAAVAQLLFFKKRLEVRAMSSHRVCSLKLCRGSGSHHL